MYIDSYISDDYDRDSIYAAIQNITATEVQRTHLQQWMTAHTDIVPAFAEKYVSVLMSQNIGSMDKLARKLEKEPRLLQMMGFDDEYDVEQIHKALMVQEAPIKNKIPLPPANQMNG
jgi:hypothetical protein